MKKVSQIILTVLIVLIYLPFGYGTIPLHLDSAITPVIPVITNSTDAAQVIPPIVISGPTAIASCTLMELMPGSIVTGTSGFIQATCPTVGSAIIFKHATSEIPTWVGSTWMQIAIMQMGYSCTFNFHDATDGHLTGQNLTSGAPVAFTDNPSPSILSAGTGTGYNYCLYYSNPTGGIATFGIAWTP